MAPSSEEICVTVTETVSEALETPIEDLPPLSNAIDVDALDSLLALAEERTSGQVTVTFTYSGLEVHIHSGELVYVRPVRGHDEEPACWYSN